MLIPDTKFFEHKMQQPYRADEQKLNVVEKGGLFPFDFMPEKLPYPGKHENAQTNLPHFGPSVIIMKFFKPDYSCTEYHNNQ